MAQFKSSWSLFGQAFVLATKETGRAIAEGTHSGFQYLAEKTKPADAKEEVVETVSSTNIVPVSK